MPRKMNSDMKTMGSKQLALLFSVSEGLLEINICFKMKVLTNRETGFVHKMALSEYMSSCVLL